MPKNDFDSRFEFRLDKQTKKLLDQLMAHYGFTHKAEFIRHLIFKEAQFAGFVDYEKSRRSKEPPLSL